MVREITLNPAGRHFGDEELECYSKRAASADLAGEIEEHLLACAGCVRRLEEIEAYGRAVRAAAHDLRSAEKPRRPLWSARLGWPVAACLALLAGGLWMRTGSVAPVAVTLEATRGLESRHADVATPLDLRPDLAGLPSFDRYLVEIVDSRGGSRWEGALLAATGSVRAPGLAAGLWFVRIYSPSRELLREYALRIGR